MRFPIHATHFPRRLAAPPEARLFPTIENVFSRQSNFETLRKVSIALKPI